ncbi:MAG: hypothetical protein LBB39_00685 [Mycoplasmataceae bacterium]|nr:hypothetical protein [Mycoplasmataceae bacterium]
MLGFSASSTSSIIAINSLINSSCLLTKRPLTLLFMNGSFFAISLFYLYPGPKNTGINRFKLNKIQNLTFILN